ncbi:MAG: hypothetical protein IJI41_03400 [Anaerolineaceae bacterium]|nr:hypothetical protein [Anaerolineaceae bacterium]
MSSKDQKVEFKDFFRFTKDGKMKSGTFAYSITYAALILVVYGAAYYFMIDVLAPLTKDLAPWLSNLIGAIVPALVGALICLIPIELISNKKPFFLGYVWIAIFALVFLIAMIILLKDDRDALSIFLHLFVIMVPAPLLIGGGSALYLWKRSERIERTSEDYD